MKDLVPHTQAPALTRQQFAALGDIPPEREWLANITSPRTRRAYEGDVSDFTEFAGISDRTELLTITRAHVIAWRKNLEAGGLAPSSIRRKLSALSSLFEYLCERQAVMGNPVDGVLRPAATSYEGATPVLSDAAARRLLAAPPPDTLKGKRDRAILATLLYHGLRRGELCALRVRDLQVRQGVPHIRVHGKGQKIRFLPTHPAALRLVPEYLELAGHRGDLVGPLFRPVRNNSTAHGLRKSLGANSVYRNVVRYWARKAGIPLDGLGVHSLRATAATNALEHQADLAEVQAWLGHASVVTTRLYDRRRRKPENSPTFAIKY